MTPLIHAHAHNDYAQPDPLVGALSRGFCSIEADVFLSKGKLLVAHDRKDLRDDRTLEAMYLRPLSERVKANGGTVYATKAEVILLVDIKADGPAAYERLKQEIKPYRSMLTSFAGGKTTKRAVTMILSGDRPTDVVAKESSRHAFLDGRTENLGGDPNLFPLVSESFLSLFRYLGAGAFGDGNSAQLTNFVGKAHKVGQKVRFWATPETRTMWTILRDHKVDLIGTDKQADLADFLTNPPPKG